MKEWLQNPKNQPVVIGLCVVMMVAAIAFILLQNGFVSLPTKQGAPPPPPPAMAGGPGVPGAPGGPGGPQTGPSAPPPMPEHANKPGAKEVAGKPEAQEGAPGKHHKPGEVAAKNGAPGKPTAVAVKPKPKPKPVAMANGGPGVPGRPGMPGGPGGAATPGSQYVQPPPAQPRPDPFKPYRNIALVAAAARPVLPPLPFVQIARYLGRGPIADVTEPKVQLASGGKPAVEANPVALPPPAPAPEVAITLPWRVAGIMKGGTGTGIKAIIMNGDQSYVVQPGDPLPDGTGTIRSIADNGVVVRTTGAVRRDVKLDSNDSTLPAGGAGRTQAAAPT